MSKVPAGGPPPPAAAPPRPQSYLDFDGPDPLTKTALWPYYATWLTGGPPESRSRQCCCWGWSFLPHWRSDQRDWLAPYWSLWCCCWCLYIKPGATSPSALRLVCDFCCVDSWLSAGDYRLRKPREKQLISSLQAVDISRAHPSHCAFYIAQQQQSQH